MNLVNNGFKKFPGLRPDLDGVIINNTKFICPKLVKN